MIIKLKSVPSGSEGEKRGVGVYTELLTKALEKYVSEIKPWKESDQTCDLTHYLFFDFFFRTLPYHHQTPVVVTVHDIIPLLFPKHFPPGVKGSLNLLWQKRSLQKASRIITDSKVSKRDIVNRLNIPEEKVKVVYLAASEVFKPIRDNKRLRKVKERYRLPDEFVLYVGDLNWSKNVPGLVRVCQKLGFSLVVVGQAAVEMPADPANRWNKDRVALIKAAQKERSIITPGMVPVKDLVAIYSLARVYGQLSFYEGFGLPMLEAMASGCPVVAAETGSLPEVGGEAAIFVDPTDPEAVEAVVSRVWRENKLRREMAKRGLKRAAEFSWQKTALETAKVYQEALNKPGDKPGL